MDYRPSANDIEQRLKKLIENEISKNTDNAEPTITLNDDQQERLLNYIENRGKAEISWHEVSNTLNTGEYFYDWKKIWAEMKNDVTAKTVIKQENANSNQELNSFEQRVLKLIENEQNKYNDAEQSKNIKDEQNSSNEDDQSITFENEQNATLNDNTILTSLEQNDDDDDEDYELVEVINTDSEDETPILEDIPPASNMEENSQRGTKSINDSIPTQEELVSPNNCNKNRQWSNQFYKKLTTSKNRKKSILTLIEKQTVQLQRKSSVCNNYYAKKTRLLEKQNQLLQRRAVAREQVYSKKIESMDRKIRLLEAKTAKKILIEMAKKK